MNTKFINRVELQGRVGTVRISPVHDTIVANFSVMTEHMYQTSDGNKVVETTWTCVAAFEGGEVNLRSLTRGSIVHLTGRLHTNRYIDASGCEKIFTEVGVAPGYYLSVFPLFAELEYQPLEKSCNVDRLVSPARPEDGKDELSAAAFEQKQGHLPDYGRFKRFHCKVCRCANFSLL